jgi:(p)ppGpp synthase/HD superfamily hydrolase
MTLKDSGNKRYDEPIDQNVGFFSKDTIPAALKMYGKIRLGSSFNSIEMYNQATAFATWVHEDQVRKYNGFLYVTHPIRCAHRALNLLEDVDLAIAMLLHDGPEDQIEKCPPSLIEVLYGKRVRALVDSLTNPSKCHPELNREARKAMDRKHVGEASIYTKMLKMIDRIDNLNELDLAKDPGFATLYCSESALLWEVLAQTASASSSPYGTLLDELKSVIDGIRIKLGVTP